MTDSSASIAALVLAAGSSRRMGACNKLLLEVGGQPMVRRVVQSLHAAGLSAVHVVTGHEAPRVREVLSGELVVFTHNEHHRHGMGTSLARGAESLPDNCEAVMVCLGDMPFIESHTIALLLQEFARRPRPAIVAPQYRGRLGHPVLFSRGYFGALMELEGDRGARPIIEDAGGAFFVVDVDDGAVLDDIDKEDDL